MRQQVQKFDERPGPAVRDDERVGAWPDAMAMHEVHVQPADPRHELRLAVQPSLGGAPVVTRRPVVGQLANIGRIDTERPGCAVIVIGPARVLQTRAERDELCVRYGDLEGRHLHRTFLLSGCMIHLLDSSLPSRAALRVARARTRATSCVENTRSTTLRRFATTSPATFAGGLGCSAQNNASSQPNTVQPRQALKSAITRRSWRLRRSARID